MIFSKLKNSGVLGINRRIGQYILPHNPRKKYPLVDNKILSAEILEKAGIPTPENYLTISSFGDIKHLLSNLNGIDEFVAKPAHGSMGNGILIIEKVLWSEKESDVIFQTTRQNQMALSDFRYYLSGILSGLYSLNGMPDSIIIQERLKIHAELDRYSYRGIPDVRVIVFKGYPVMAMIRFPTQSSGGRANLHQGAVGCGIDINSGKLNYAVCGNRLMTHHPDTGLIFTELVIPYWKEVLTIAARCFEVTEMGYLGIDIVIDPVKGPMLLEMNARPGLSIQTANMEGLVPRLEKIEQAPNDLSPLQRVEYSMTLF